MDSFTEDKVWLGFDLSTQQLKSIAINENLEVVCEASVQFDSDLPEFRTTGGVHRHEDNQTATAPVLMWVKALELILDRLRVNGLDFSQVVGISGSGQQHGSVYWKRGARAVLQSLQGGKFLHEQLSQCFALGESPIWMDSSTSRECRQLEAHLGGAQHLAEVTGSRAYERFTASQIAKIAHTKAEVYSSTERISLVSSFLASLFIGDYAPIDLSDGSGMNLLDIKEKRWSSECLQFCGTELEAKLGSEVVPSSQVIGPLSEYFVERYGFHKDCYVVAFTGDNPASLAGMCLGPNDVAISLGTSDTAFLSLSTPKPALDGHIFCNPINEEHFMGLICFKNGSLTRERIRNTCADASWDIFNQLLESTPRGAFGNIGFYLDLPEIYPVVSGDFRYNRFDNEVTSFAAEVEIRACVESQFLRLRIHAENLGFKRSNSTRVLATGGASANHSIIAVLADVFNAPVYTYSIPNSAVLGSALLAKYAKEKETTSYYDMVLKLNANFKLVTKPSPDAGEIYDSLAERYRKLEDKLESKANGD